MLLNHLRKEISSYQPWMTSAESLKMIMILLKTYNMKLLLSFHQITSYHTASRDHLLGIVRMPWLTAAAGGPGPGQDSPDKWRQPHAYRTKATVSGYTTVKLDKLLTCTVGKLLSRIWFHKIIYELLKLDVIFLGEKIETEKLHLFDRGDVFWEQFRG